MPHTAVTAPAGAPPRHVERFTDDWQFRLGDPDPATTGAAHAVLAAARPVPGDPGALGALPEGAAAGLAAPCATLDDLLTADADPATAWRVLDLPHDHAVEGDFDPAAPGGTGRLPFEGAAWYRKRILADGTAPDDRLELEFDGATACATVWLDGRPLGARPFGASSFRVDLTGLVAAGAGSVVAVRVENPPDAARWYPGAGVHREVRLVRSHQARVSHWGTTVTTSGAPDGPATVQVRTVLDGPDAGLDRLTVTVALVDRADGAVVGRVRHTGVRVSGLRGTTLLGRAVVAAPRRWRPGAPALYDAVTEVVADDGSVLDRTTDRFGVRDVRWTAHDGLHVDGVRVPVNGVCVHDDLGALGNVANRSGWARRLDILQGMGCNAVRTAHNPPAPELLELCDERGVLVLDEAFDMWEMRKTTGDYAQHFPLWHDADLRALVRRDRNHPSVVLWSSGNEVLEQGSPTGPDLSRRLRAVVHEEDPTRPVTVACQFPEAGHNGFAGSVDVFGYNYKPELYAGFLADHPDQPLLGTETASCVSTRGVYVFPVSDDKLEGRADFQVSSYDLSAAPWAQIPDTEFAAQDANPAVAGEFVWTGFDYLGEPTPFNDDATNLLNFTDPELRARIETELAELGQVRVPSRSSYFGIVDLAGFPKDRYHLYKARWAPDVPSVHVLPHWTWPGREGEITPVHVYTSGDEAELFLDGVSLGRRRRGPGRYRLRWDDVRYAPGELTVVAYRDGAEWARTAVRTAGPAHRLEATPERTTVAGDGRDLAYVTVRVLDAQGTPVPDAAHELHFTVTGPGTLAALDAGDPTSHENFRGGRMRAFHGLCSAVLRPARGGSGTLTLHVEAEGLAAGTCEVHVG